MSERSRRNGLASTLTARRVVVLILLVTFPLGVVWSSGRAFAQNATVGAADGSAGNSVGQGGFVGTGLAPVVVNLGDLPQATEQQLSARRVWHRPLDGLSDAEYWARKQLARARAAAGLEGARSAAPSEFGPLPEGPGAPTLINLSPVFTAQQESGPFGPFPSDMALAVSNKFVVQFVNTSIAVYNKSGTLQPGFPKSADAFFQLAPGTFTTDPRGFYDWTNKRFVFIMLYQPAG